MDVFIEDVSDPSYTRSQIMHMLDRYREDNPDMDVYLDGDNRAIMARPHSVQTAMEDR